ncbi:MAG: YHS domain-containing protein [Lysobacterales bacterium]|nr:MAG: YHS domain-containing protein [Xanthomonadales bacterium]
MSDGCFGGRVHKRSERQPDIRGIRPRGCFNRNTSSDTIGSSDQASCSVRQPDASRTKADGATREKTELPLERSFGVEMSASGTSLYRGRRVSPQRNPLRTARRTLMDNHTVLIVMDPICGMELQANQVSATLLFMGQTYSFCCVECRDEFAHNPEKCVVCLAHDPTWCEGLRCSFLRISQTHKS